MTRRTRLVIFDCDGTLVDSQHIIVAAMNRAFAAHDRSPPPRAATLSIVGLSLLEAIRALTSEDDPDAASLVEAYKNAFHALRAEPDHLEPLYDGARAALDHLADADDVRLAIATGKSQRGVRLVLGHHGLYDRFVSIQTADDAPSKPHPGMILNALAATGVAPQDAVMVGDTHFDMTMARAAGVTPIGVSWGYHEVSALHEAGAGTVIDHFDALAPLLDRLWRQAAPIAEAAR